MSTFRWACQKKFSEGLQNLGFISVARQSSTNFYFERQSTNILSPFFTIQLQLKFTTGIHPIKLLYWQVLKKKSIFPDPAWLKIDNKQFSIFIYGSYFIPKVECVDISDIISLLNLNSFQNDAVELKQGLKSPGNQ